MLKGFTVGKFGYLMANQYNINEDKVKACCLDAINNQIDTLVVYPSQVRFAKELGTELNIGTTIGYPFGIYTTASKVFETEEAVENGADILFIMVDSSLIADEKWEQLEEQVAQCKKVCKDRKAVLLGEMSMYTEEGKRRLGELAKKYAYEGVALSAAFAFNTIFHQTEEKLETVFVHESFPEDVVFFRKGFGDALRIYAWSDCMTEEKGQRLLAAGADFIYTENLETFLE